MAPSRGRRGDADPGHSGGPHLPLCKHLARSAVLPVGAKYWSNFHQERYTAQILCIQFLVPSLAFLPNVSSILTLRIAKKKLRMFASDSLYSFQCAVCHSARCGTGHSLSLVSRRRSCRVPGRGHVTRNLTPGFRDTFLLVVLRLVSSLLVMGH